MVVSLLSVVIRQHLKLLHPCQIEEGTVLKVAGGLIIEHPLILPFVKEVVGFLI